MCSDIFDFQSVVVVVGSLTRNSICRGRSGEGIVVFFLSVQQDFCGSMAHSHCTFRQIFSDHVTAWQPHTHTYSRGCICLPLPLPLSLSLFLSACLLCSLITLVFLLHEQINRRQLNLPVPLSVPLSVAAPYFPLHHVSLPACLSVFI